MRTSEVKNVIVWIGLAQELNLSKGVEEIYDNVNIRRNISDEWLA